MEANRARHFLLHVLKFVFGVAGRRLLPMNTECLLNRYPPYEKSIFTGIIVNALIIPITDALDVVDELPKICSPTFRNELNSIASHDDFFKFVGRYSVKALAELKNGAQSSPSLFISEVTGFLTEIFIEGASVENVVRNWNEYAKQLLKEAEGRTSFRKFDLSVFVDLTRERSFIVDAMNFLFGILNAKEGVKLRSESAQNNLTVKVESALRCVVHHHRQFLFMCDYEDLRDYFHKRCIKNFDVKDFFELCVCYAEILTVTDSCLQCSQNTCDFLLLVIEHAKRQKKFEYIDIHIAARDLLENFKTLYVLD